MAFLFLVLNSPGGIFAQKATDSFYRLPLYSLTKGISFGFEEILALIFFLKAISSRKTQPVRSLPFFWGDLKILFGLFLFLIFISPTMGISIDSVRHLKAVAIGLSFFYSLNFLLKDSEELLSFFSVLLPFTILALIFQLFSLFSNSIFIAFIDPEVNRIGLVSNQAGGIYERPIEMPHLLLINFIVSFFLLQITNSKVNYNKSLLVIINLISFLSIILSATRAWFLAFLLLYLLYFLLFKQNFPRFIGYALISITLIIGLIYSYPILEAQMERALIRLATLEFLYEGDTSLGGTAQRLEYHAPLVMKAFEQSSIIFGAGFSDLYMNSANYHVGYHNMLLNAGLIGVFVFFIIFLKIMLNYLRLQKKLPKELQTYVPSFLIIALLIINTSSQQLGFIASFSSMFTQALAFVFLDYGRRFPASK